MHGYFQTQKNTKTKKRNKKNHGKTKPNEDTVSENDSHEPAHKK